MRDIDISPTLVFFTSCFGGVIALVDAMVFLIGLVFCVMRVMSVADVNDQLNCLVDVAVFVLAGLILVASLVGILVPGCSGIDHSWLRWFGPRSCLGGVRRLHQALALFQRGFRAATVRRWMHSD